MTSLMKWMVAFCGQLLVLVAVLHPSEVAGWRAVLVVSEIHSSPDLGTLPRVAFLILHVAGLLGFLRSCRLLYSVTGQSS